MEIANQYKEKDEQLFAEVQKLKDGDFSNSNAVYELSEKYIYKIVNDIVKNHHTTEDLMQEAYIQIYNKIGTLQEVKAFYVWAGRIATNLTLRYLQKNSKEMLATVDEEGDTDFIFDTASEDNEKFIPESVLVDREKQRLIAEIIDKLSTEQKICIQYFYYEEMSVNQIAEAMGCSTGTIKSRLNYARKSIKEAVVELDEKHGTRLYSLASAPLFLIIFRAAVEGLLPVVAAGAASAASVGGASAVSGVSSAGNAASVGGASVAGSTGSASVVGSTANVSVATATAGSATSASTAGVTAVSAAIKAKIALLAGSLMLVGGGVSTAVNVTQIIQEPKQAKVVEVIDEADEETGTWIEETNNDRETAVEEKSNDVVEVAVAEGEEIVEKTSPNTFTKTETFSVDYKYSQEELFQLMESGVVIEEAGIDPYECECVIATELNMFDDATNDVSFTYNAEYPEEEATEDAQFFWAPSIDHALLMVGAGSPAHDKYEITIDGKEYVFEINEFIGDVSSGYYEELEDFVATITYEGIYYEK